MTNLDAYISTVKSNIENFNQYINENVDGLKARGERTDDPVINLFKAYQYAYEGEFGHYIKTKMYQYNNGHNISE